METRKEPYDLKINGDVCSCCNNLLQKEIKNAGYLKGGECGYCRYLDRPFGSCGNTASTHYDGCSCEYGEKDFLYIKCETCISPKCIKCGGKHFCEGNGCGGIICGKCVEKKEFNNKWKKSTPSEKLNLYGITKLKILAKNKKIKSFSKYNKKNLINILTPLVNENDFPIKTKSCN